MGIVGRAGRLLEWSGVVPRGGSAQRLDATLRAYYRRHGRRLSLSTGFHLVGWLLGAVEAYVILIFLEIPTDRVTATVIEALGAGVWFATFLVPASVGAFESANAAAFEALGLGAGAGLAFSLSKPKQIVIAGGAAAQDTLAMLAIVRRNYLPNKILLLADGAEGQQVLGSYLEFLKDMKPIGGKATAFVCENYTCQLPTADPERLRQQLLPKH